MKTTFFKFYNKDNLLQYDNIALCGCQCNYAVQHGHTYTLSVPPVGAVVPLVVDAALVITADDAFRQAGLLPAHGGVEDMIDLEGRLSAAAGAVAGVGGSFKAAAGADVRECAAADAAVGAAVGIVRAAAGAKRVW